MTSPPLDIAQALMPEEDDLVSFLHVYTIQEFNPKKRVTSYIKIPPSTNIHWTHFRPSWLGKGSPQYGLTYKDSKVEYDILCNANCESGVYQPFNWVIPGLPFADDGAFYIRVDFPSNNGALQIEAVGFEDIIPMTYNEYTLYNSRATYEISNVEIPWIFRRNVDTGLYRLMPCEYITACQYCIPASSTLLEHTIS